MRGIAALGVLLVHIHAYWLHDIRVHGVSLLSLVVHTAGYGFKGVDLFIVLSGFCLFYPTLSPTSKPFSTKSFYLRRVFRLLPPYYAVLIPTFLLELIPSIQKLVVGAPVTPLDLLANLTLTQTLFNSTLASINGSFWSIALEMQLYLAFPLAILIARKYGMRKLLLVALAAAVGWELLHQWYRTVPASAAFCGAFDKQLPARWIQFVCGMTAAYLVRNPRPKQWLAALATLAIVGPMAVVEVPMRLPDSIALPLWGIAAASLVVAASSVPERFFVGRQPLSLFTRIGVVSYSLYLIHQPLVLLVEPLVASLHLGVYATFAVGLFVVLPVLLAIASLLFVCVERPFMNLAKKIA